MRSEIRFAGHDPIPTWPERLQALAGLWHGPLDPARRENVRSEIWTLLVGALELKLRRQIGRRADIDAEVAYDLAVQRALDLFARFARDDWDPRSSSPAQLQRYFDLLARNGLIDHLRSRAGKSRAREQSLDACPVSALAIAEDDLAADRRLLGKVMLECAHRLTHRMQVAWYLRAFHDLSSRRIAAHPDVNMAPTAVDMALARARRTMQHCLHEKGFGKVDFGVGAFAACWEAFRQHGGIAVSDSETEERP